MVPDPFLASLGDLAYEAGLEVARLYRAGCAEYRKGDGSPVTEADRAAEALIRAGLARLAPGVSIVGEEGVADGDRPSAADRFFLVDPLDGTNDFVAGDSGEFAVNIALVEHGRAALGVVYAPISGALYVGAAGAGAFRARCDPVNKDAVVYRPIRAAEPPGDPLRVIVSRRATRDGAFSAMAKRLPAHRLIEMSSSLKLCAVAAGEADLYPRFGPVSEWDLAAGHAVLSGAGGDLTHLDGSALCYRGQPDDYEVSHFAAFGGPGAAAALRAALS